MPVRGGDDEARQRANPPLLRCVEAEPMHHPVEPRRLAVVGPSDRLAVDVGEQPRHRPAGDPFAHVPPVVVRGAHRPLLVRLGAVRLHAVARLPTRVVAKGAEYRYLVCITRRLGGLTSTISDSSAAAPPASSQRIVLPSANSPSGVSR